MNIIFIVLESCLFLLSLVLAFLWMFHPQDTYEPTIVLFGVLLTVLETFRQKLPREQANPEIEELKTALQKAINQLEDVKVNSNPNIPTLQSKYVNSPDREKDYEKHRILSLVKLRSEVESRITEYVNSRGVALDRENITNACNELPFPDIFKTFIKKFLEYTEDLTQETPSMSKWANSAGTKVLDLLDSLITETPENQTPKCQNGQSKK